MSIKKIILPTIALAFAANNMLAMNQQNIAVFRYNPNAQEKLTYVGPLSTVMSFSMPGKPYTYENVNIDIDKEAIQQKFLVSCTFSSGKRALITRTKDITLCAQAEKIYNSLPWWEK